MVANFTWRNPFGADDGPPPGFKAACQASGTFRARQHTLRDHMTPPPQGFQPWAEALKPQFGGRPFPGSWEGLDAHGTKRTILVMDYAGVPAAVKDWVEEAEQSGRALFGVYEDVPPDDDDAPFVEAGEPGEPGKPGKLTPTVVFNTTASPRTSPDDTGEGRVMIFAAGALYDILPLWVAKDSGCEGSWKPVPV